MWLGCMVLGVSDMSRAVGFWRQALGYRVREDEAGPTWTTLVPADGAGAHLGLQLSETPPRRHARMHVDLHVTDVAEQSAEVERLVALGAERLDWDLYPEDPDFVVLADPEGNVFCVVDTTHGQA